MKSFDYSFFEESLRKTRRMREYWGYGVNEVAVKEGFQSKADVCKLVAREESCLLIDTSSFFRPTSDDDWLALESRMGQPLPEDFAAFHALYSEAIILTRAQPVHLFSAETILKEMRTFTGRDRKPRRFFRFAGTFQTDSEYYGLRQIAPGSPDWEVVYAALEPDEFLEGATDFGEYPYWAKTHDVPEAIAPSFYDWLKHLIETDGMEDLYLEPVSPGGAWYDPA